MNLTCFVLLTTVSSGVHLGATSITTGPKAQVVGTIKEDSINEASGIVASRKHDGVYWTHNDGKDGVLHAIRRDGTEIGSAKIDAKVRDWEDIAVDDAGNLYVADVGNNSENRKHVQIYRLTEPDPGDLDGEKSTKLEVQEMWKVHFPDEPANVESLIIREGQGFLIFKRPEGLPAEVYRFDLREHKKGKMTKVATISVDQPVTSASLGRDGKHLAVLTRDFLWVFEVNGDLANVSNAAPTRFPLPPLQSEGCTFAQGEVLVVAESREILSVPFNPAETHPVSGTTKPGE